MPAPRPSAARRPTRTKPPAPGRTPHSPIEARMGGQTSPTPTPLGPPPSNVLRDNQDQFPRAQVMPFRYPGQGPTQGRSWRLPPSTPLQPEIPNLVPEAAGNTASDGTLRAFATLPPDTQRLILAQTRAAGLPLDDYSLRDGQQGVILASLTPGPPNDIDLEAAIGAARLPSAWITATPEGPHVYELSDTQPGGGATRFTGYNEAQIESILQTAREWDLRNGPTFPTYNPIDYTPSEDVAAEQEE